MIVDAKGDEVSQLYTSYHQLDNLLSSSQQYLICQNRLKFYINITSDTVLFCCCR